MGLDFTFPTGGNVLVQGGRATFDQCTVLAVGTLSFGGAPLAVGNADVHLMACRIRSNDQFGFVPAVQGQNAHITAVGCQFAGSPLSTAFYYSTAPAIDLTDSTLHAAGCSLAAGIYGGNFVGGVRANGGRVWLSDSSVTGRLGCPIQGSASVWVDRCVLTPASSGCAALPSGGLLGVSRPQPLQNGAPFTLTYKTAPNGYAAVFAHHALATVEIPGLHSQTQWIGLGAMNLGIVFANASGEATVSWNIPAGTWLVDVPLWFQGLTGLALPLQLSPVTGGLIR